MVENVLPCGGIDMKTLINNPYGKGLMLVFMVCNLITVSCASYVKVHPERINIQSLLRQGDTVKIVTKDNREIEFKVVEVSDEAIIGENETVLFTDISKLEEKGLSEQGKNALVITGKILLITLYVAAAGLGSMGSGGMGISGVGFGGCN